MASWQAWTRSFPWNEGNKPRTPRHGRQDTRTFTGTIDWSPTSWQGDQRWVYQMYFSKDLEQIIGTISKPLFGWEFGGNLFDQDLQKVLVKASKSQMYKMCCIQNHTAADRLIITA